VTSCSILSISVFQRNMLPPPSRLKCVTLLPLRWSQHVYSKLCVYPQDCTHNPVHHSLNTSYHENLKSLLPKYYCFLVMVIHMYFWTFTVLFELNHAVVYFCLRTGGPNDKPYSIMLHFIQDVQERNCMVWRGPMFSDLKKIEHCK